ncbi:hypothetical protein RND81_12G052200 [Saponaria officinalis]|uniref:Uncharacterized protein n=1 Tax=Saponaria officinalis TaxID=3572 RepID=A0AAW1H3E8_SAPOF
MKYRQNPKIEFKTQRKPRTITLIMCPLRFILVLFSALLAVYFAWRSARSLDQNDQQLNTSVISQKLSMMLQMIKDGFWVFVDMASGRYLWRKLKGIKEDDQILLTSTPSIHIQVVHMLYHTCRGAFYNDNIYSYTL